MLVDIENAQTRLGGVGRTTIFQLIREGELGTVKIGRRTMIPVADIEEYMQRHLTRAGRPDPVRHVTCKRCGHEHACAPRLAGDAPE